MPSHESMDPDAPSAYGPEGRWTQLRRERDEWKRRAQDEFARASAAMVERDEAREEAKGERYIAGMIRANYCELAREAAGLLTAAGAPGAAAMFEEAAERGPGV